MSIGRSTSTEAHNTAFTHPDASGAGIPGIGYHEIAATRAWTAMRLLLAEVF